MEASERFFIRVGFTSNIRLGWKGLPGANTLTNKKNLYVKFVIHTRDVDIAILLNDVISIETLLSFQIATAGDSDKHVILYRLCKHYFTAVKSFIR